VYQLSFWIPAAITCGVVAVACLLISRMARTVEHRLIDADLDYRRRMERRAARTSARVEDSDRADRLQSIANHHRAADYLLFGVIGLLGVNAGLYVITMLPAIVSVPVLILLLGLAAVAVWMIRRRPGYRPDAEVGGAAEPGVAR
jgi:Flp pilus assembly protein TadB